MLEQELATAPARGQQFAVAVDARNRDESSAAGSVEARDESALGAQPEPVRTRSRRCSRDDAAVIDQPAAAPTGKSRVGGVRAFVATARAASRSLAQSTARAPSGAARPLIRTTRGLGRLNPSDETGDRDDRHDVRDHADELFGQ